MSLFQNSVLNKYLKGIDSEKAEKAWNKFKSHFHNPEIQENIRNSKEEQYQGEFLIDLFVEVLGYVKNPNPDFNLTTELKNIKGAKKTDGAILQNKKAIAVIELKGTNTVDLAKVEVQAFGYKNNQPGCRYVITSNFEKLRFYIDNAVDFEEFNLFQLTKEQFSVLYLCLSEENLLKGIPAQIKNESLTREETVTKQLYKDYSQFRNEIFDDIQKQNSTYDKLTLFKKTQKLLDRFLFIFFAEDTLLVPPNSIDKIVSKWKDDVAFGDIKPLYSIFKQYFNVLNVGRPAMGDREEIFAYNGGLFSPDELLDSIEINDDLLYKHTVNLSKYDFESEVSVNILGHIFEHSLTEIETIQAQLKGEEIDKSKTKRKKDGVFYTPKYITKYIVDNTIGELCTDKKAELSIIESEFEKERKGRKQATLKKLITQLDDYRNWLLQLTICDPACGSGAFLNQALEFLINEHRYIDELKAKLLGGSMVFTEVQNDILEHNIFGVDINEESVEIAKLSLWLRTAKKGRKLTSLNENIKCGNSLIDEEEVAGNQAFDWKNEFPKIMATGGFDVILGNPPYGILIDKSTQEIYSENFPLTKYKINLYVLFIEKMLQEFSRGVVHFIIPKSLLFNTYYEDIRRALIETTELNEIYTITEKVFEDAEVGSSLLLKFTITNNPNTKNVVRLATAEKITNFITSTGLVENNLAQDSFLTVPNCEISIVSNDFESIIRKLNNFKPIKNYYKLKNGLNPGNIKHILINEKKESVYHKPIIWGKEISRYHIQWGGDYINYNENIGETISIEDVRTKEGMNKQNKIDFALRKPDLFESNKLVVRKTGDKLIACFDSNNYYFDTLVHGIYSISKEYKLKPLLALLNSRPATIFYRFLHDIKGKVFAKISLDNLGSFPIPESIIQKSDVLEKLVDDNLSNASELSKLRSSFSTVLQSKFEIEKLSKKLNFWYELTFKEFSKELRKKKVKLTLDEETEWLEFFNNKADTAKSLKLKIETNNNEIDNLVFDLYGLTVEEKNIIEQAIK